MQTVIICCDGSAIGNPGPGGWAALIRVVGTTQELVLTGSHPATTNNRMELTAAIEALRVLKRPCQIKASTDSQYLQKGMAEWVTKWKSNDWVGASGRPVLNQDLWLQLDQLAAQHEIDWIWVRGHSEDPDQERVDALALQAARCQANALIAT